MGMVRDHLRPLLHRKRRLLRADERGLARLSGNGKSLNFTLLSCFEDALAPIFFSTNILETESIFL